MAALSVVESMQGVQPVAVGVGREPVGLALVGEEVVRVGVGVCAYHCGQDVVGAAEPLPGVEAKEYAGGDDHRGVGVRVGLVGAAQPARDLLYLLHGHGLICGRKYAAAKLVHSPANNRAADGVHRRSMGVWA